MSKYEKFMKLLNDNGYVARMNASVNLAPEPSWMSEEEKQDALKNFVKAAITSSIETDAELKDAFSAAAVEMMIDKVFEDLDLKKDESYQPSQRDLIAKAMADLLFSNAAFAKRN